MGGVPVEPQDLAVLEMLRSLEDLRLSIPDVQHRLVAGLRPRVPWEAIGESLHLTAMGAKHRFRVAEREGAAAGDAPRTRSRRGRATTAGSD